MKKQIVRVLWDDARDISGWKKEADIIQNAEDASAGLVETVGFLVLKTKKYIVISSSFSDPLYNNSSRIPIGMVLKIEKLCKKKA